MPHSKNFWNKIAKSYDKQVIKKYNQAYKDTIELSKKYLNPGYSVLDFACGTGITTIEMSNFVKKIHAIDISDKMIAVARKKADDQNIHNIDFRVSDLFDQQLDNVKFDVILAFNILYLVEDIDKTIERIHKLMNPSGVFISATDCLGEKRSFLSFANMLFSKMCIFPSSQQYSLKELEKIIDRNGFELVETKILYPNPPNYFIAAKKTGL